MREKDYDMAVTEKFTSPNVSESFLIEVELLWANLKNKKAFQS